MTAITTLDDLGARRFPWCPTPAPLTPRSRLLGVTWAGNLLVCCFVLGFGTWSTFAPLQSAAIAFGAVESEFEPEDYSASRGWHHQGDSGRGRRCCALRSNTDLFGRHQSALRSRQPSGPVVGRDSTRSTATGGTAGGGAGFVSVEREFRQRRPSLPGRRISSKRGGRSFSRRSPSFVKRGRRSKGKSLASRPRQMHLRSGRRSCARKRPWSQSSSARASSGVRAI